MALKLTIPHYYDFGEEKSLVGEDLINPDSWDALRTRTSGDFALPATREGWERVADDHPELADRARAIDRVLAEHGVETLASYGVGGATLECWLARLSPDRRLVLGEYAPATVERLRQIFTEAEVREHDLLADPPLEADLHLFHRIDTEFSNAQWRQIFARFAGAPVLLVAGDLVEDWRRVLAEFRQRGGIRRRATRAGLIRNMEAFESLWSRTHTATPIELDLHAWILEPKAGLR